MRTVAPLTDAERVAFVAACRALLTSNDGKPAAYRHRGRSPAFVDCIGVPILGLAAVGREVADQRHYSPVPDGHTLREVLLSHLGEPVATSPVTNADLQPGDIPLLRWYAPNGEPLRTHVGVVTPLPYPGEGYCLLHASNDDGRVVEHRMDDRWLSRITEVFRP